MDGISELAKMFKERENKPYMGPRVGQVISPLPEIKVKLGDKILLDKQRLIIASHIYEHFGWTDETGTYYLAEGDKVILIPSTDEQIYFLVDKAVAP
ncbi:DUF2577 family protein [Caloranaerobacter sp. DY30410]|uniref:DUF2577 family protein n=1 Tax=Caloranaerobacter sp. DY30410 TaxID=3238305 RepID=UPI003CFEA210